MYKFSCINYVFPPISTISYGAYLTLITDKLKPYPMVVSVDLQLFNDDHPLMTSYIFAVEPIDVVMPSFHDKASTPSILLMNTSYVKQNKGFGRSSLIRVLLKMVCFVIQTYSVPCEDCIP